MSSIRICRRLAIAAVVAFALAATSSAIARPFETNYAGSYSFAPIAQSSTAVSPQHNGSGNPGWSYIAMGCVVLIGASGAVVAVRRHRRHHESGSTLAA